MTEFTKDTAAELFEIRMIGSVARMFLTRQVTPSPAQSAMMSRKSEVTLRDIAEIAHQLDFHVEIGTMPRGDESEGSQ